MTLILNVPAQMIFDWHDRDGIPFEVSFVILEKRKAICNLRELLDIAVSRGWNRKQARQRINTAWRDVYPADKAAFRNWCGMGEEK